MGYQAIAVGISIGLTLITTLAYMIYERTRYVTNNRNAIGDHFEVHRNPICPICLESMDEDEGPDSVILNCGHELHQQCLISLDNHRNLFMTNRCPVCRTPIRLQ